MNTYFQLTSERKNLQVVAEKERLKTDLEQIGNSYGADIKTREIEKQVLRHEVHSLQRRLKKSNSNLIEVAGHIDTLNFKIKILGDEMRGKLKAKDM